MTSLFCSALKFAGRQIHELSGVHQFHALPTSISNKNVTSSFSYWSIDFIRTIVRNNFPRAKEGKRIKTHGWKTLLSSRNGRRQIMRRILKGRFYLSH